MCFDKSNTLKYCVTSKNKIPLLQLIITTDGNKDYFNIQNVIVIIYCQLHYECTQCHYCYGAFMVFQVFR